MLMNAEQVPTVYCSSSVLSTLANSIGNNHYATGQSEIIFHLCKTISTTHLSV